MLSGKLLIQNLKMPNMGEGSKYINLLSKDVKSKKSFFSKYIKLNLLKKVCKSNTLANFQLEEIIKKHLKPKNKSLKILDIGTGLCNFYPNNVKNSNNKYYDCDLSSEMKDILMKRGIIFIEADISIDKLNLNDNSFDLIICSHLIEHLDSSVNLLEEIERLLKISGIAFIKTPDIKFVKWNFFNDYTHRKPYTKSSLIQQIESESLKILNCYSTTLYKDFSIKLIKGNPFNPINLIFYIVGLFTYYFRKDMREIICISKKIKN